MELASYYERILKVNDDLKKKYEILKELSRTKNKHNKWKENLLFVEFIEKLDSYEMLSEMDSELISEKLSYSVCISEGGHVIWDKLKCNNLVIKYEKISGCIDVSKQYYVLWNNLDLPIIKSRLKSIINYVEDLEAVDFDYLLISEDFDIIMEAKKNGYVRIGFINI